MTRFVVSSAVNPTPSNPASSRAAPSSRSSASRGRAHAEEPEPEDVPRLREEAVRDLTRKTPRRSRDRSDTMAMSRVLPPGSRLRRCPAPRTRLVRQPELPVHFRVGTRVHLSMEPVLQCPVSDPNLLLLPSSVFVPKHHPHRRPTMLPSRGCCHPESQPHQGDVTLASPTPNSRLCQVELS